MFLIWVIKQHKPLEYSQDLAENINLILEPDLVLSQFFLNVRNDVACIGAAFVL